MTNSTVVVKRRSRKPTEDGDAAVASLLKVNDAIINDLTAVFKLLADKSRLKIVLALAQEGQMHVTALLVDGALRVERPRGHEFVPQLIEALPGMIDSVSVGKPTLEDVFIRLTGHQFEGERT